ncbi:MAG: ABC-type transporter, integral rane subunit [Clostridia bacterium]|nr:ABC-type transporter, integral rane subunit [Clostridia bacterium]
MKKTGKLFNDNIKIILLYSAIILIWQLSYFILVEKLSAVKMYIFPSPKGIILSLIKLTSNKILIDAIFNSFEKILIGFSISIILGVILGLLMKRYSFLSKAMKPLILGLQTLPSICYVPFAVLWFGLSDSATVFVIIVGSVFSICISTESAIKNVNPTFIRVAKTMGASNFDVYTKVVLPASIPEFISGLKHGWSFAWRALIAGEMVSGSIGGLGYVLLIGRELLDINQVMVVILIIILISVIIEKLIFGKAENIIRKKIGQD